GHRHDAELLREPAHAERLDALLVGQGDGRDKDPLPVQRRAWPFGLVDLRGHPASSCGRASGTSQPRLDKCTSYTLGWAYRVYGVHHDEGGDHEGDRSGYLRAGGR